MTCFYTITSFREALSELLKVRKNVYAGVEKEICREFKGCPIENIRNNRDMVLIEEEWVIIKLRLPDKKQRLSKKDGYRLIYLVSKQTDDVTFLTIYPKNGPSQRISVPKDELKSLLSQYLSEALSGTLQPYVPLIAED